MSWRDRPYAYDGGSGGRLGGLSLPRAGRVVKWLIIINVVTFLVQVFADRPRPDSGYGWGIMSEWLGASTHGWWQVWRYVTFQFLHDTGGIWHITLNMLGLYFLGSPLEAKLGSRRFLAFYLTCGIVAGIAYVIIGALVGNPNWVPIIGASGGVYGLVLAAAIYFPHFQIIFLFFPVPIRLAAIIIFAGMGFVIFRSVASMHQDPAAFGRAMGDVAHLGGALAAAVWIAVERSAGGSGAYGRLRRGAWQKSLARKVQRQKEIDRILEKIHTNGLNSLSWSEKRFLKKATREQREEESRISRM